ncbi:MAG: TonB family protein [Hyphomicrobiales bacterium]|nr:TonB family protein [Hyphomicrobiales bacterium]
MKKRNQDRNFSNANDAHSLNLLDLSERRRRSGGVYWAMLILMIAAYGAYMVTIANTEPTTVGSASFAGSNDNLSELASLEDSQALEKADREPIEINIPRPSSPVSEDGLAPLPKQAEQPLEQRSDSAAPPPPTEPVIEAEPAVREEAPVIVHAIAKLHRVSPAARAILRQVNETTHHNNVHKGDIADADAKTIKTAASAPPIPKRRPFITSEVVSHQFSSQSGGRLIRTKRRTKKIPSYVRSYRRNVRAHIATHRPSGGFGSGRVSVSFTLSASGKINRAQVIRAPASENLDQRALSAIYNAAPFPAAPGKMAAKHRAFVVSFVFQ